MTSAARRIQGHLHTIGHLLVSLLWPPPAPAAESWRGALQDPISGRIYVTGWLTRAGRGTTLVILVHGLGGSADSPYLLRASRVASELGIDTLRLNLRGADPEAGDFYHGGLTAELHAAVKDRAAAGYERIAVLGYSMGGHVVLRFAAEVEEPRVAAVAAVCAPLQLGTVSAGSSIVPVGRYTASGSYAICATAFRSSNGRAYGCRTPTARFAALGRFVTGTT